MQHKWMVVFTALVLFSLLIAPVGTAQAQVAFQEGNPDCPPYEPDLLQEEELLSSLPLECVKTYKEFARQADPSATARDGQPMATGGPDSLGYTAELEMGVPSGFVTVFQDEIDGAMSFLTASTSGTTIHKVTADNHLGFRPAVARLTNGNYLYAWDKFYPDPSKPWRNIEYTLLNPSGTVILPITKLVDNSSATLRTDDDTPSIALAPDGTIGVVWSRYLRNNATNRSNYNIFFATLNASGTQVTGLTNITNNTIWGTSSDYNIPWLTEPTIAATSDNRFIISWLDSREVADFTYEDNVWYAVRNTAGASVLAPTALTTDNKSQDPILNSLTDGKIIILWGNYEIFNSVLHYAVINSNGTISRYGGPVEFGSMNYAIVWPQSYDAVLLPNGKVALAWVNGLGVEFGILNSSYNLESGPHIGNDDTPGGGISVTTNASSHVIMTWVADHYSKLFYALGDSSGGFLTDPVAYHTNGEYINVNWHGQGSAPYEADDVEPDTTPPVVTSIQRASASPTNAASVNFTVAFSEPVSGVSGGDFTPYATGNITGASMITVTGSGSVYTVTVNTGSGNGTLSLNVPVGASITDMAGNPIGGLPVTSGETYTILKTDATWQYVGPAGFTGGAVNYPTFALDGDTAYVAFGDGANGSRLSVMKFNGTSWVNVGPAGFSPAAATFPSLAFNNGIPYVAFSDGSNNEKLNLMKFDGTAWVNVGPAGFSNRALFTSLVFDNGTPYVAFGDGANGFRLSVMKFNGTSWVNVGPAGFTNGSISVASNQIALALDGGTPYVAFTDLSIGSKANVMKFNGTSWVNVGPADFSSGTVSDLSLAFDNGIPYLAFTEASDGYKANVVKFNGTSWVNVGSTGFSGGQAKYTSLAFDSGIPYVAFSDVPNGHKTSVMKFDAPSDAWIHVGPAGFSNRAQFISLALTGGTPYVLFQDVDNDFDLSVMKLVSDEVTAPTVTSIVRAGANHTSAASVNFTVTFSEPVLNVDANDFTLHITGSITGASIGSVTGSGSTRTVTVNTGSGNGTLRLNVPVGASITDVAGNPITGLPFTGGQTYTILKAATFSDVATNHWAWQYVERLSNAGVTGGCGSGNYCPEAPVTRAQMAIFLERGIHGSSYNPPAVGSSTGFGDVQPNHWAAAWIKQLAADGITGGCGSGNYCPEVAVTRAQMAVFLLRSKYGASYSPPAVGSSTAFTDVDPTHWAGAWIKQLVAEGITAGCGSGNYCPEAPVTRAQMAVFLVRTFNLP